MRQLFPIYQFKETVLVVCIQTVKLYAHTKITADSADKLKIHNKCYYETCTKQQSMA